MKIFFLIILVVTIILLGRLLAQKYKKRVKMLECFLSFLSFAKFSVSYMAIPTLNIIKEYKALNGNVLPFLIKVKEPLAECLKANVSAVTDLSAKQKEIIISFFSSFGISDELSQINLIENYETIVSVELKNARSESEDKGKLITRLSVLGGLALAVILI